MTNHFPDTGNMVDEDCDDLRPRHKYACSDRTCGALDCKTCYPFSFDSGLEDDDQTV
jgi:hypothetical protein